MESELAARAARIEVLENELKGERLKTTLLQRENAALREELEELKESMEPPSFLKSASNTPAKPGDKPPRVRRTSGAIGRSLDDKSAKAGISGELFDPETVLNFKITYVTKDQETKTNLENAIRRNPMLGSLDVHQIRDIVDSMEVGRYKVGDTIIQEGSQGDKLYISADNGTFEVVAGTSTIATFGSWVVFGELALLYGCQRTATINLIESDDDGTDKEDVQVWSIKRRTFQMITLKTGMVRQRKTLSFVRNISFFSHLKDKEVELLRLVDALTEERYMPGEYVFQQGAIGETFYIIQEGEVVVENKSGAAGKDPVFVATLRQGDTFGETALLHDDIRTADVKAVTDIVLLALGRKMFERTLSLVEKKYESALPVSTIYDADGMGLMPTTSSSHSVDPTYEDLLMQDFVILGRLGVGGFGRVELVHMIGNDTKTYALKCLAKKQLVERKQQAQVFRERDLQRSIKHPFIARLYGTFKDPCFLYMLMEPCLGGEMWCVLRDCGRLTDAEAQFITGCVIEALSYLHRRHIVYRDLKPENLMLDSRGYCKLVDFGFAKRLDGPAFKTWTFCGTPEYLAPEVILNKGHSFTADIWAVGILIFELLSGWPPFVSNKQVEVYSNVLRGFDNLTRFPADSFPAVPKSLVLSLCRLKPAKRLGAGLGGSGIGAIQSHKWFSNFNWLSLRSQTMEPLIVPNISSETDLSNFDQKDKNKVKPTSPDHSGWDEGF